MSAKILDGRALAKDLIAQLKKEVNALQKQTGDVPHLVNAMVGDNSSCCAYAKSQKRAAQEIGIAYEMLNLPQETTQKDFVARIVQLNQDKKVNGIMIHKPFPPQIDYSAAANLIETNKDLEGINVVNIGRMLLGETKIIPCTPAAVIEHMDKTGLDIRGKEVVIVGASDIVGKPLGLLLLRRMATVTFCHIATSEAGRLKEHVERADILVVAVGKANLIKGEWIKEGAVVIDVGINQVGGKIVGDVEFDSAKKKASFITPVPGGVGPVTVVMLMRNGIEAYKIQKGIK